jgi:hypothetical protein
MVVCKCGEGEGDTSVAIGPVGFKEGVADRARTFFLDLDRSSVCGVGSRGVAVGEVQRFKLERWYVEQRDASWGLALKEKYLSMGGGRKEG